MTAVTTDAPVRPWEDDAPIVDRTERAMIHACRVHKGTDACPDDAEGCVAYCGLSMEGWTACNEDDTDIAPWCIVCWDMWKKARGLG